MVKPNKSTPASAGTDESEPVFVKAPEDLTRFTETAFGIARKKVIDEATGEERVRSFSVEIKYDPLTGDTLKANLKMQDSMSDAVHKFKVEAGRNVFKF